MVPDKICSIFFLMTIFPVKMMSVDSKKTTAPRFETELTYKMVILSFALSQCTWRAVQSTLLQNFQIEISPNNEAQIDQKY